MILRHATPARNRESITREGGLLRRYATGKKKAVWLHPGGKTLWALEHVAARHHVEAGECIVLRVHISETDGRLKRGPRGTYYYEGDIPLENITAVKTADEALWAGGW